MTIALERPVSTTDPAAHSGDFPASLSVAAEITCDGRRGSSVHAAGGRRPAPRTRCSGCLPLFDGGDAYGEGVRSAIAPMCEACAASVPRLREGHVKLRVREADRSTCAGPSTRTPGHQTGSGRSPLYDSPGLPLVLARQAVRELRLTTVIAFATTIP